MSTRLGILLAALVLAVTPEAMTAQRAPINTTSTVLTVVTSPMAGGTVIVLDVPADLWPALSPKAELIERPGMEKRIR